MKGAVFEREKWRRKGIRADANGDGDGAGRTTVTMKEVIVRKGKCVNASAGLRNLKVG